MGVDGRKDPLGNCLKSKSCWTIVFADLEMMPGNKETCVVTERSLQCCVDRFLCYVY